MTDEELNKLIWYISKNDIEVNTIFCLIDVLTQTIKERDWLAWELHCRCNMCRQTQESPYCDIDDCIKEYWEVPTKEDWIEESKKEHPPKI